MLRISAVSPTVGNHRRHSAPPRRFLSCNGRGKKDKTEHRPLFPLPFSFCPGSTTEYSHVFVSDWYPVSSIMQRVQRSGEAVSGAARSHRRYIRARRRRMDSRTALDSRAPAVLAVLRQLEIVALPRHAGRDVPDASPPFRFGSRSLLLIAAKGDSMSVLVTSEIPRTRG